MAQPKDTDIALDIVAAVAPVVLRIQSNNAGAGQRITYISESVSEWGYLCEDFLSGAITLDDIVHPQDRAILLAKVAQHRANRQDRYNLHLRAMTKAGQPVWANVACSVRRDAHGDVQYTDCMLSVDAAAVVDKGPLPVHALTQQQIFGTVLQTMQNRQPGDVLPAILGIIGQYLGVGAVALYQDIAGGDQSQAVHRWHNTACPEGPGFGDVIPYSWMSGLFPGEQTGGLFAQDSNDAPFLVDNGQKSALALPVYRDCHVYGFVLFEDGFSPRQWTEEVLAFLHNVAGVIGVVLQQHSIFDEARTAAWRDQLTGLHNRYPFDEYLRKAMHQAQQSGQQGYVIFIDMDDFKFINEGYGLEYGDALLAEVAAYIKRHYSCYGQLFRFGGDEFVMLVGHEHAEHVPAIKEGLLSRARHPWGILNNEFYCTVSLGVVCFPDQDMKVADVIRNAEIAVHNAKSLGKNNCVVFNQGMDSVSLNRAETEQRMRECIENDFEGFEVYYQPVVDTNGAIKGAEALLRWFDKEGNITMPNDFIPLAEHLGLIVPLGKFVLRQAAMECRSINQQYPDFTINVNVSTRQFQHPDFLLDVETILAQTGVDCTNIVLEVTEGRLAEDFEQIKMLLEQLRMMGLRIAMDDFGTGYSSLSNMRRLPLDIVKIDREFVTDVTHDAYSQSFIRLITNLTHSMGRTVCVEGVETAAQYSYCAECRVNHIQGYYFYKPMPKKMLHEVINRKANIRH